MSVPPSHHASMDRVFWLGLVLGAVFGAILGVGMDLWKRPLDRLLDRRLEHRTSMRGEALLRHLEQDRQALRDHVVEVILQTTLVTSLIGILAGIAFGASNLFAWVHPADDEFRAFAATLSTLGQILAVIGAVYIVHMAGDALAVARRVSQAHRSPSTATSPPPDPGSSDPGG